MSYVEFLVEGRNRPLLFQKLKKHGVAVLKSKSVDEKTLILRVRAKDKEKVFAIFGKTWYNKQIGTGGWCAVTDFLRKRSAFVIGLVAFLVAVIVANGRIFGVSVSGADNKLCYEVAEICKEEGAIRFARFSSLDFKRIERRIFALDERISYVTVDKNGYNLNVSLVTASEEDKSRFFAGKALCSTVSGTLKYLEVYRGTAVKNVGDKVYAGDELIRGEFSVPENSFPTVAMGRAVVECETSYDFITELFDDESASRALEKARFFTQQESYTEQSVEEITVGEISVLRVKLKYLVNIGG